MSIMEVKNVGYTYDNRRKVLRSINVQMEQGKLYADTKVIQRIQEILQKHSQGLNTEKESKL